MHDPMPYEDERLSAYLDDELTSSEIAELEADLARDPALRAELDTLRSLQGFLRSSAPVAAPPGFLEDVLALAAEEDNVVQLAWWRRPFGIPLEGLAVAAAALLVVYVALPTSGSPVAEPTEVAAGRAALKSAPSKLDDAKEAAPTYLQRKLDVPDDGVAVVDPVEPLEAVEAVEAVDKAPWKAPPKKAKPPVSKGVDKDFKTPSLDAKGVAGDAVTNTGDLIGEAQNTGLTNTGAAEPLFAQVPYSYAVYSEDPEVLLRLAALAARYQGEIKGSGELEVMELSGKDAASVVVKLPSHALQDFGQSLKRLGKVKAIADNSMFAGDPVEVRIDVKLFGGTSGTGELKRSKKAPAVDTYDK